ncbi:unnamed protein product, partial [Closterium sp. NIES-64]
RCIDFAQGQQKNRILAEVASNALVLSQDPFGNFVMLWPDPGPPPLVCAGPGAAVGDGGGGGAAAGAVRAIGAAKFSSNVVEKCLKLAPDNCRHLIIQELVVSPLLGQLLQDPFANYVVQSALTVAKDLFANYVVQTALIVAKVRLAPWGLQEGGSGGREGVGDEGMGDGGERDGPLAGHNPGNSCLSSAEFLPLPQSPSPPWPLAIHPLLPVLCPPSSFRPTLPLTPPSPPPSFFQGPPLYTALGPLYTALVEAIRPHLPSLRSSPYGKRILARTNLRPK